MQVVAKGKGFSTLQLLKDAKLAGLAFNYKTFNPFAPSAVIETQERQILLNVTGLGDINYPAAVEYLNSVLTDGQVLYIHNNIGLDAITQGPSVKGTRMRFNDVPLVLHELYMGRAIHYAPIFNTKRGRK